MSFWTLVSRFILRGRILILLVLSGITFFLSTQWKYAHFSHIEAIQVLKQSSVMTWQHINMHGEYDFEVSNKKSIFDLKNILEFKI